jgi:hypothetical protein
MLAEASNMGPLVAHCRYALSRLSRHGGRAEEAAEHYATAMSLYRALDMPLWSEHLQAQPGAGLDRPFGS